MDHPQCFCLPNSTVCSALGGPHRAIPTGSVRMECVRGGRSNRNWVTPLNVSKITSFCWAARHALPLLISMQVIALIDPGLFTCCRLGWDLPQEQRDSAGGWGALLVQTGVSPAFWTCDFLLAILPSCKLTNGSSSITELAVISDCRFLHSFP